MTPTNAKEALTHAAHVARATWGQEIAKGFLVALSEAGATVGQTVEMVKHLWGLKARAAAVVGLTEWTLSHGVPSKTDARHFVSGYAKAKPAPPPAQVVPAAPSLDSWMRHYDAFQAERAVYGRCD